MNVKDYKELKIWEKGIQIVDAIYVLTKNFPKEEMYGLINQMRRAAISISSNIAEGFVRKHKKEWLQFLRISLGSCAELDTQIIISHRQNYISDINLKKIAEDINHEMRMISSLINKLSV